MSKVFIIKTLIKSLDREKGEISFDHVALDGMPDYIKEVYELLSKEIVYSNILVYEENKDVFGLFVDLKDDETELFEELEDEVDFYTFLNKLLKYKKLDLDLNFQIALNSKVKELSPTIEKLIILLVTSIKLELESSSSNKVINSYEN